MPPKRSKHRNTADRNTDDIVFKDEEQHYATVTKSLGNGRFEIESDDGFTRIGKLRGNMKKSQWVTSGSLVLISLREFGEHSSSKADILLKYSDAAAKQLKRYGELEWMEEKTREADPESDIEFVDDDEIDLSTV